MNYKTSLLLFFHVSFNLANLYIWELCLYMSIFSFFVPKQRRQQLWGFSPSSVPPSREFSFSHLPPSSHSDPCPTYQTVAMGLNCVCYCWTSCFKSVVENVVLQSLYNTLTRIMSVNGPLH